MARANRRDSGASSPGRLTWRGRAALAVFGVHVVLLFFPPLPPDVKGSLWDYLLAYAAVLLGALELARWAPVLADRWQRLPGTGRVAGVYGAASGRTGAGAVRGSNPGVLVALYALLALEVAASEGFRETRGRDPKVPARLPSPSAGRSGPPP